MSWRGKSPGEKPGEYKWTWLWIARNQVRSDRQAKLIATLSSGLRVDIRQNRVQPLYEPCWRPNCRTLGTLWDMTMDYWTTSRWLPIVAISVVVISRPGRCPAIAMGLSPWKPRRNWCQAGCRRRRAQRSRTETAGCLRSWWRARLPTSCEPDCIWPSRTWLPTAFCAGRY